MSANGRWHFDTLIPGQSGGALIAPDGSRWWLANTTTQEGRQLVTAIERISNADLGQVKAALRRYGVHAPLCEKEPCSCGYAEVLAALDAEAQA